MLRGMKTSSCLSLRLMFGLLPYPALAQSATPELGSSVLQMLLGLGFIVALIFGSLWLLKRLAAPRGAGAQVLKVIAGQAVGPRERVVVVEVGDTALVLGVAPGQVRTLHTMARTALPATPASITPSLPPFAAKLKRMMEQRNAPRA